MASAALAVALAAALGCGLVAGVFFAFSSFVMPALGRLPAPQAVAAMQSINVRAVTPWFMAAFLGTAAVCVAAVALGLADLAATYARCGIAGGVLYLVGVFGTTIACNVPRNDALAALDPAAEAAAGAWARYLVEWTAWNHVRAAAGLAACALEIAAIYFLAQSP